MRKEILKEILKELYKNIILNEMNIRAINRKIEKQPDLKEAFEKQLIDLKYESQARSDQIIIIREMQNEKNY